MYAILFGALICSSFDRLIVTPKGHQRQTLLCFKSTQNVSPNSIGKISLKCPKFLCEKKAVWKVTKTDTILYCRDA